VLQNLYEMNSAELHPEVMLYAAFKPKISLTNCTCRPIAFR
jgi:hypothetical protein